MAEDIKDEAALRLRRLLEIRAIGIAALHEGAQGLDCWEYLTELKGLRVRGHKLEWREAKVAHLVALRQRATQVVGSMRTLRELCDEKGLEDRFVAFEALVKSSLGSIRLTNHAFREDNFAEMAHEPIWDRVGDHLKSLKENGYEAFLNSGTLLGVVRDERLIDHDDDIDIAVILKANNRQAAAGEWLELRQRLSDEGVLDEDAINDPSILKLTPVNGVQIDLFPAWFEADKFYVYPHTLGELSKTDVLPLKACSITAYPIPANPEKMLALNYGDGWKTPDPYFKFPWHIATERFSSFLEGVRV
ncbi:LicD family protein [Sulfitobacter donghicola]|uniref:LicD/FKTN/FKRP nucleotidyltransferase domain-containing protein n=1 Tax=Sulfitobacter donghicola DSW-25 = KCTC 12864 = JCM 14565 TaxID=1300350 RepID=A0A073IE75_9RHOB|nr:LicD family protein [Sulfitobacter donghicola]KEJ87806.1 hypothetical protein DSW25_05035 [Sulfitobacter donghicola DSW-25 = KCTC 12864 = JCM 14565]KIN68341.1 Coagulation factor 5/8 type-like protein [Sulfitobacter donghicola DSW-25 = KCTC 12864 = JCM 14565]